MTDPMNVLQPNTLGFSQENYGVADLVRNSGLGVSEVLAKANPQAAMQSREKTSPQAAKDKLRTSAARQYGKTKQEVGF